MRALPKLHRVVDSQVKLYSFDTSSLLNGRRDLLPPETFVSLWELFDGMVGTSVISVDVVRDELIRRDDETSAWAKAQNGLFVPLELDIQIAVRQVLTACPKLVSVGNQRDGADPFVVALALARGGTVVSEESRGGSLRKARIPDACEELDIPHLRLIEFVQEQGWKF